MKVTFEYYNPALADIKEALQALLPSGVSDADIDTEKVRAAIVQAIQAMSEDTLDALVQHALDSMSDPKGSRPC